MAQLFRIAPANVQKNSIFATAKHLFEKHVLTENREKVKISTHKSPDSNKLIEKQPYDPLAGYVFVLTGTCPEEGEYSVCAYSPSDGHTYYIGTPEPCES